MLYTESMYIGARQKKKLFVFFVTLIIFVFIGVGVFWVNNEMAELSEPKNVVLSNVGEESVSVTWTTEVQTEGFLVLYKDGEKVKEFNDSRGSGKRHTHYVDIAGLSPNTSYDFEIFSSGERWLNSDGELYSFVTSPLASNLKAPKIVEGFVEVEDVLVFLMVDDLVPHYPLSTFINNGIWSFDLSKLSHPDSPDFELRNDTPLKILFYSNEGPAVIRGNKNILFEEGEFLQKVEFSEGENIFLLIPDLAKFKEEIIVEEEEFVEVEEVPEPDEEVLGVDDNEEDQEKVEDVREKLEVSENLTDYGLY